MAKWVKRIALVVVIIAIFAAIKTIIGLNEMARIGVGYKVKVTCSEVFVAGRDLNDVLDSDFFGIDPMLPRAKIKLNRDTAVVTGSLYGLGTSRAVYRPESGCTVVADKGVKDVNIPVPNPVGHTYIVDIDPQIQGPLMALFDEGGNSHSIGTRGALVVQNGKIFGEHYSAGFDKNTRQQSWSMAKSVTSALVGILADNGRINIEETQLIEDWKDSDRRSEITLNSLLHMSSGLDTHEVYSDVKSDVVQMLFNRRDTGQFAAQQKYENPPETHFEYSSATTNLISRFIRERIGNDAEYHAFPRTALFDPLGMKSAIFEVDPEGNFIGSSYIYATLRDYAKLGQLFLQAGVWEGEQVISEDWVRYSVSPGPATKGAYGAHWWLNFDSKMFPDFPKDTYYMSGNDGQFVIVIPSKNAVIVRTGITRSPTDFGTDVYPLLLGIFKAL